MIALVIQARMGSTRLPGKVLREICGVPMLALLLSRLKDAKRIDAIVVATSTDKLDDALAEFCARFGVACYRGSESDVLDRYYKAALPFNPDHVVRVTADCPLNHAEVVDFVVDAYLESGCDYYSNSNHEPDYLEDGFDVEVFSFAALEAAWKNARLLSEREHVTPYIKNSGHYTCGWKKYRADYHTKLSVDSPADFAAVTAIFEHFAPERQFGMADVLDLLAKKPEIQRLNSDSVINAGYAKSLKNDREIE